MPIRSSAPPSTPVASRAPDAATRGGAPPADATPAGHADAGSAVPEAGLDRALRSVSADARSWTFDSAGSRVPELLGEGAPTWQFGIDLDAFRSLAAGLPDDFMRVASHWIETYNSRGHAAQLDKLEQLAAGASWWQRLRHGKALDHLTHCVQRERSALAVHEQRLAEHERQQSPRLLANLRGFDLSRASGAGAPSSLDSEQRQALSDYMAPNGNSDPGGSTAINGALRGQRPLGYASYRAAHRMLTALCALPSVPAQRNGSDLRIWRGSSHLPGAVADPAELTVGQTVVDPAFVSCSRTRTGILADTYLIRIDRPRHARDVSPYGTHDTNALEEELLFAPGTRFKYLGYDAADGAHVFTTDLGD
ncbi:MAG: hypothetical protein JXR83_02750 [Deltaproteobacteria bacterium]|nr:hypothetical protein [Deltaproteobacteria bacterium]